LRQSPPGSPISGAVQVWPLPSAEVLLSSTCKRCRVGGGAPAGAGLRPPLKRHVRVSRTPLSRRHRREMREEGDRRVAPRRTRRVEPGPPVSSDADVRVFARRRTDPPHRPSSSGVPPRPSCLRPPPSPTHSSRRVRGPVAFATLQVSCSGPTTGQASRPTSLPLIGVLTPAAAGTLPVLLRSRRVLPYRAARTHLGTRGGWITPSSP
jgi:hypothetical protein